MSLQLTRRPGAEIVFEGLASGQEEISLDNFPGIITDTRTVTLQNDIILHIQDHLGVRYWAKNEKIIQWQLVIDKQDTDTDINMPASTFKNTVFLLGDELEKPLKLASFQKQDLALVKDIDSLQYRQHIYWFMLNARKCTLWLDNHDEHIHSVYLS